MKSFSFLKNDNFKGHEILYYPIIFSVLNEKFNFALHKEIADINEKHKLWVISEPESGKRILSIPKSDQYDLEKAKKEAKTNLNVFVDRVGELKFYNAVKDSILRNSKNLKITKSMVGRETNPTTKKTFLMHQGEGREKKLHEYDFSFTHYIPMNSHGENPIAFKFVAFRDDAGLLNVSEPNSGKKVWAGFYPGLSDRSIAKRAIEELLQRLGADKVYSVLVKG